MTFEKGQMVVCLHPGLWCGEVGFVIRDSGNSVCVDFYPDPGSKFYEKHACHDGVVRAAFDRGSLKLYEANTIQSEALAYCKKELGR